eukprot:scaffold1627_cov126-Isochrysis_galbana.AAC.1
MWCRRRPQPQPQAPSTQQSPTPHKLVLVLVLVRAIAIGHWGRTGQQGTSGCAPTRLLGYSDTGGEPWRGSPSYSRCS